MNVTIWGKTYRVALRRRGKIDFDKKEKERQVWRHPYPDPLLDFP